MKSVGSAEPTDATASPRYLFVTGRLAEFALRRMLEELAPRAGFHAEVAVVEDRRQDPFPRREHLTGDRLIEGRAADDHLLLRREQHLGHPLDQLLFHDRVQPDFLVAC